VSTNLLPASRALPLEPAAVLELVLASESTTLTATRCMMGVEKEKGRYIQCAQHFWYGTVNIHGGGITEGSCQNLNLGISEGISGDSAKGDLRRLVVTDQGNSSGCHPRRQSIQPQLTFLKRTREDTQDTPPINPLQILHTHRTSPRPQPSGPSSPPSDIGIRQSLGLSG
jgi:hypothetical protein